MKLSVSNLEEFVLCTRTDGGFRGKGRVVHEQQQLCIGGPCCCDVDELSAIRRRATRLVDQNRIAKNGADTAAAAQLLGDLSAPGFSSSAGFFQASE
ncbi:unnamed protein product [Heligmosomoides polygyrus]|uniref:Uncharacterized protein n=1 Tax=Heligmosomoides polygyrus TaxID=6339 RepID=A0A183FN58_HELPZ|nr:unnamed protein product [Heligmosomoides polygyrus]